MRKLFFAVAITAVSAGLVFAPCIPVHYVKPQRFDKNRKRCAECKIGGYAAGPSTPALPRSDVGLTVPPGHSVTLDSADRTSILTPQLTPNKFVLIAAKGVIVWTPNNVNGYSWVTATSSVKARHCNSFPGATTALKIAACLADLPATGGIADLRGFQGTQTIAKDIFSSVTIPVQLVIGAATFVLSSDTAIPSTMTLEFSDGGTLASATGTTLTIKGKIIAAPTQIFSGSGAVFVSGDRSTAVYPEWFGAKGNDSNDDTGAMESTLLAGAGKTIHFRPGAIYRVYRYLDLYSGTSIWGYGATIKKMGPLVVFKNHGSDSTHYDAATDINILGLTIDQNAQSGYNMQFKNITNLRIRECKTFGSSPALASGGNINIDGAASNVWIEDNNWQNSGGIYIRTYNPEAASYDQSINNVFIRNNYFYNPVAWNELLAIFTASGQADINNVVVEGNTLDASVSATGAIAIYTDVSAGSARVKKVSISNNTLIGPATALAGYQLIHIIDGPQDVSIHDNHLIGGRFGVGISHDNGIYGSGLQITNNNFDGSVTNAILGGDPGFIYSGNILETHGGGISVTGAFITGGTISNNRMTGFPATGAAIDIEQLSRISVIGNVTKNFKDGIFLDRSSFVQFENNTIDSPSRYGIYLRDSEGKGETHDVILQRNEVIGKVTTAFRLYTDSTISRINWDTTNSQTREK